MPKGVYERKSMLTTSYRGFTRVAQVRRADGSGSDAVVSCNCGGCGAQLTRTARAVKLAQKEKRPFQCRDCHGVQVRKTRQAKAEALRAAG